MICIRRQLCALGKVIENPQEIFGQMAWIFLRFNVFLRTQLERGPYTLTGHTAFFSCGVN